MGKHMTRTRQRDIGQDRRQGQQMTDRDMIMYSTGWNTAIKVARDILADFVALKEGELNGLGVSQPPKR